jgi:hypothetical protein
MALAPLVSAKQRNEAAKAIVILRMSSTQLLCEATKGKRLKPKVGSQDPRRLSAPGEWDHVTRCVGFGAANLQRQ